MSVFFIADTHFGDENILRYENRPFENVFEMNEKIVSNWNGLVADDDEIYFLGDVGDASCINRLKGKKYLIKGNHDKLDNAEYISLGFDKVYDLPVIYNDFWILSHEPMYVNQNMPYANIFGHVHNNPMYKTVSNRSFCVSVERIDYTPVSFENIMISVSNEN